MILIVFFVGTTSFMLTWFLCPVILVVLVFCGLVVVSICLVVLVGLCCCLFWLICLIKVCLWFMLLCVVVFTVVSVLLLVDVFGFMFDFGLWTTCYLDLTAVFVWRS